MTIEKENNKIREELNIDKIESNLVNNVISKPEEFGESSRSNSHVMRLRYVLVGRFTSFFLGFIRRKHTSFEEIILNPISQIGYILNINGARDKEIFRH